MILSNKDFQIEITKDTQYTLFSTDNKFYNHIIQMEKYNRNDFVCVYCIFVHSLTADYSVAIIGRAYGNVKNCAVLENNIIIILIDNYVVFFDLIDEKLEKKIRVLDFGTGIEIYPFDDGYIVNGEIDIIKVDKSGSKIWNFSGRDIWVRPNGESSINILRDRLLLTDFEGYTYHLNKLGKLI
ncbi:hypothetical protein CPAST_c09020 [Clostridium pasteurianum DSM 525 = ATCC 6013]|uniref:Uncharacterized protein n=1 Tax=Clostridium pasteurianum DSM 525 = ATCC 6013 TaxID=1262449 RepID=A0A0H3J2H0_CLOPA|nr:hypothetical protein [Clostridium pasteurianum]AJA47002.1 hypothetical protein CPAST_c09020 [Clostridium pasteurianum DSM 525 = ATCC 6013]AJA50990.1 hypothetical protein CLPA_c09020 [Clostridium pasteurianum DSM 525 = ATCC 6013]AOZ74376.1 hypothetical protein AQ983_04360 [Clostridium pasteurianum DSM 525 = ATCC 6013]AOZ78174.1 hypothetical protein AQ984_04365 [Clostridium pasteurianum]ELP58251.1 hypothetical protein F502_16155 [Clostridium pasteurianum DSM 525 = ATCC 6013]